MTGRRRTPALALVLTVAAVLPGAGRAARAAVPPPVHVPEGAAFVHDVRPGPGVSSVKRLSDYLPELAGTPGDTPVYVLQGSEPGGTAFVAGGTHPNEIAGVMAAIVLVEHARVARGRLIVVPHADNAAVDWRDPKHPVPAWITIRTASGPRRFKVGARLVRADLQGAPDPPVFRHPASAGTLPGFEARNLDRAYPGRPDGTLTQRIAAAVMRLLINENVDVAFDLHEAGPSSRLAWTVVAHPKSLEIAATAVIDLDAAGIEMKLEQSSKTFRGLSHREWGDATRAQTFLFETPNPGQGNASRTADIVGDRSLPLVRRVAVQLATLEAVLAAYDAQAGSPRQVVLSDLPRPVDLEAAGLGSVLQ